MSVQGSLRSKIELLKINQTWGKKEKGNQNIKGLFSKGSLSNILRPL